MSADIIVPAFRDAALTAACIEAVYATTGSERGRVIIIEDASPDPLLRPALDAFLAKYDDLLVLHNPENLGFVGSVNVALELSCTDVVLLNNDALPTQGWLKELLEVASLDARIACVAPLTDHGAISSVPDFWGNSKLDVAVERVELTGLPRFTEAPTAVGFCLLMKRAVVDLIGPLDPVYGRGYQEENDWVQRARAQGYFAVRANWAFVHHRGSVSFGGERDGLDARNSKILARRYPHFEPEMFEFLHDTEARVASHSVTEQLQGLSVALDLRGGEDRGVELARVLHRHDGLKVAACVAEGASSLRERLEGLGVDVIAPGDLESFQVLHRLSPPRTLKDCLELLTPPLHVVMNADHGSSAAAPTAFHRYRDWALHRAFMPATLRSVQAVVVPSSAHREQLLRDVTVVPERVHVVPPFIKAPGASRENLSGREPYFVWVGNDRPHNNLRLLLNAYSRLRVRRDQKGQGTPELLLATAPGLSLPAGARSVPLADCELIAKAWGLISLSADAAVDFMVLEALAAGTPVLHLNGLGQVWTGAGGRMPVAPTPEGIADAWEPLINSETLRATMGRAGKAQVASLSAEATASALIPVYRNIVRNPSAESLRERRWVTRLLLSAQP